MELLLKCALIFLARVCDVSLGTLRTVAVVNGRGYLALGLGFIEVLIWIFAVSAVVRDALEEPIYAFAYAFGFAAGNLVGVMIDHKLAIGKQVVRLFSRNGPELAAKLREAGFRVTTFDGHGRDGPVCMLLMETRRRSMAKIVRLARSVDESCYYIIDDVRAASAPSIGLPPTRWRAIVKKK